MRTRQRMAGLIAILVSLAIAGPVEGTGLEPEGWADRVCDFPRDLTGAMTVESIPAAHGVDVVWDGQGYGVGWAAGPLGFRRVAADGTTLTPVEEIVPSGAPTGVRMVWSGSRYAVAWTDLRWTNGEISLALLGSDGRLVGPETRITNDPGRSQSPDLAWNGSGYGLVWSDDRTGNWEVFFARTDANGAKIGSDVALSSNPDSDMFPSVVWMGEAIRRYAVAWVRGNGVFVSILDEDGVAIDSYYPYSVVYGTVAFGSVSLVWTGSELGIAWIDERDGNWEIYFTRLDPLGAKIQPDTRVTNSSGSSSSPKLLYTGSEYGLLWGELVAGSPERHFGRIAADGTPLGGIRQVTVGGTSGSGIDFGTVGYGIVFGATPQDEVRFVGLGCHFDETPPTCPEGIAVTADSSAGVTLGWTAPGVDRETEIAYTRIYRDGSPIGLTLGATFTDSPRPLGSPSYTARTMNAEGVESTGCGVVVADTPAADCGADWTGSRTVSVGGTRLDPQVAWNGREYGILWVDSAVGTGALAFRSMAADGTPLAPELSVTTDSNAPETPSLVSDGSGWAVAWSDERDSNREIYFARMGADGLRNGSDLRVTSDSESSRSPSLSGTDVGYLVAYTDYRIGSGEVWATPITAAGALGGPDVQVSASTKDVWDPDVVWNGAELGVVWSDGRGAAPIIYFDRLDALGVGGVDRRVSFSSNPASSPTLVSNGVGWGVAWLEEISGSNRIVFNRLALDGTRLGSDIRIPSAGGSAGPPRLVWTGAEYVLAWAEDLAGNEEIFTATLDPTGIVLGLPTRLTASLSIDDQKPDLAMGGNGLALVHRMAKYQNEIRFVGLGCGPLDVSPPSCPGSPREIKRNPTRVTLAWGPSLDTESDFAHYTVYRNSDPIAVTTELDWADPAFDPTAGYFYWITATNAAGAESGDCEVVDTTDVVPPTCPANLLATSVTSGSVTLAWLPASDALSGVREYRLFRDDALLATIPPESCGFVDSTVTSGRPYNYVVLALDWAGNLSPACASSGVWVSTSPILLMITPEENGLDARLEWTDIGLPEYVVYRSTSPATASELERVGLPTTSDPVLRDGVDLWCYFIQQRGQ